MKRLSTSRRFTLRVRAATRDVLLTMPSRSSLKLGARIRRAPCGLDRRASGAPAAARRFRALRGDCRCAASITPSSIVPASAASCGRKQSARGPLICVTGEKPHIARRVADFLKREARKDIEAAVARHAKRLGVAPRRITLRDTASRWGSCSSTGGLNFSWRLILAPPDILDYLAAHEVAHILHMDHSPTFWKLTRRLFPETERAEAWLKVHGAGSAPLRREHGLRTALSRERRSLRAAGRGPAVATADDRRP